MYLIAQNLHGPCVTTPKSSLSNFTAKFSHINPCLDRNRACFAIAKDGLAAHSKVVVPHFGPSFLTRSIPTVKTKDWLGLTCKLCRIGIPTRGSSSRWLSKFWYLSRVDAQYWKPITEYLTAIPWGMKASIYIAHSSWLTVTGNSRVPLLGG